MCSVPKKDGWVRLFDVSCHEKHPKGYTIYKVVSKVFSYSCPEVCTQTSVWKRYNDVRKLHREMLRLHQALYLKGNLPDVPNTGYFKRFDPDVIEVRRAAILDLLKAIALYPPLFTSPMFVKFFSDGERESVSECDALPEPFLDPSPAASVDGSCMTSSSAGMTSSVVSAAPDRDDMLSALDPFCATPVERHDTAPSNLQLLSDSPDLLRDLRPVYATTDGRASETALSVDDAELAALDRAQTALPSPCDEEPVHTEEHLNVHPSSSVERADTSISPTDENTSDTKMLPTDVSTAATKMSPTDGGTADTQMLPTDVTITDAKMSPTDESTLDTKVLPTDVTTTDAKMLPTDGSTVPVTRDDRPGSSLSSQIAISVGDSDGDYILQAANEISLGQEYESQRRFLEAFNQYTKGIGTLLNGTQGDRLTSRREAVRRKTAQYLRRAEQLNAICLERSAGTASQSLGGLSGWYCVEGGFRVSAAGIRLSRYRVAALRGHNLSVQHRNTGQMYLLKVVHKCAGPLDASCSTTFLPETVPYMVRLHEVVETESAFFLLLEDLGADCLLWDHLRRLNRSSTSVQQSQIRQDIATPASTHMDYSTETSPASPPNPVDSPSDPSSPPVTNSPAETAPASPPNPVDSPSDPSSPPVTNSPAETAPASPPNPVDSPSDPSSPPVTNSPAETAPASPPNPVDSPSDPSSPPVTNSPAETAPASPPNPVDSPSDPSSPPVTNSPTETSPASPPNPVDSPSDPSSPPVTNSPAETALKPVDIPSAPFPPSPSAYSPSDPSPSPPVAASPPPPPVHLLGCSYLSLFEEYARCSRRRRGSSLLARNLSHPDPYEDLSVDPVGDVTAVCDSDQSDAPVSAVDQSDHSIYDITAMRDDVNTAKPVYTTDLSKYLIYDTNQSEHPVSAADQSQNPVSAADQSEHPVSAADQSQHPVYDFAAVCDDVDSAEIVRRSVQLISSVDRTLHISVLPAICRSHCKLSERSTEQTLLEVVGEGDSAGSSEAVDEADFQQPFISSSINFTNTEQLLIQHNTHITQHNTHITQHNAHITQPATHTTRQQHPTNKNTHLTHIITHSTQPPTHTTQQSTHSTQPPTHNTQQPTHATQPTTLTNQPPTHTTQQSTHSTQTTIQNTRPPIHTSQPPIHTSQSPIHSSQHRRCHSDVVSCSVGPVAPGWPCERRRPLLQPADPSTAAGGTCVVPPSLPTPGQYQWPPARVSEQLVRSWSVQLVTALDRLHQLGIFCRDLSPANLLITSGGALRLTYFCRLRGVRRRVSPAAAVGCWTPQLLAGDAAADWRSVGVLLYELLTGVPLSWWGRGRTAVLRLPDRLSPAARSLLRQLLGSRQQLLTAADVRGNPFFSDVDWHQAAAAK